MILKKKLLLLLLSILVTNSVLGWQNDPPKKEFRATWMATVYNLDWPVSSGWSTSLQKQDLITKLDRLKSSGINAVFFQVRTHGDAMYQSDIEPWSKFLTGTEGKAPDPYFDPLEFAIEEAHKRGMELHAWLNPYIALRTIPSDFTQKVAQQDEFKSFLPFAQKQYNEDNYDLMLETAERDSMHVSNTHPEWIMVVNNAIGILDPGLPEVMSYVSSIIVDIVKRYDVDGIHFDDYFYPYPSDHMASSSTNNALDDSTFIKYPRGFTSKYDWRRNNVNMFVEMVHDSINTYKPWVKFGISPFGIWKDGVPTGISGTDAYSVIYADGLAWLEAQTIDYITPQLYWAFSRFGTGQDYGVLADWWSNEAQTYGRHTYPGHGLYRTSSSTFSGSLFNANEIPRQIRHNRGNDNITGSVFFRSNNITTYSSKGFADSLKNDFYVYESLQPTMDWKSLDSLESPTNLQVVRDVEKEYIFELSWDKPQQDLVTKTTATGQVDSLIKYAVYRVDAAFEPNEIEEREFAENLVTVTGETNYTDNAPPSEAGYWYFVTAVTRNNVESTPTTAVNAGTVISNETESGAPGTFTLLQNYPNPFNPTTNISFSIPTSGYVELDVFDVVGRNVARLVEGSLSAGTHHVQFNASQLTSGIYLYRLSTGTNSITKRMMLIK